MNKNKILEVKNLSFKFNKEDSLFFEEINFEIYENEKIVIFGLNGSGKSTLAKILVNLYLPEKGSILLWNKTISMVLQNPNYALIGKTVEEELIFDLQNLNISRKEMIKKFNELVNKFNLHKILNKNIDELSGGNKQKISLISILTFNPDLIILDEYDNLLDELEKRIFNKIITNLTNNENKTIIMISHDINNVFYADRIFYIDKNHKIKIYSKKDFLNYIINDKNMKEEIAIPSILQFNYNLSLDLDNTIDKSIQDILNK